MNKALNIYKKLLLDHKDSYITTMHEIIKVYEYNQKYNSLFNSCQELLCNTKKSYNVPYEHLLKLYQKKGF